MCVPDPKSSTSISFTSDSDQAASTSGEIDAAVEAGERVSSSGRVGARDICGDKGAVGARAGIEALATLIVSWHL